ncbi:DUF4386 domain-containing protein [Dactylosporangium sp. CA-233914]|uniref:DUF4386 domain-containing protein n=1 Tax=Dactylosporangium sp. CA-233914 TaxID=3239934 RepID=UPI003D8D2ADE
MTVSAPSRPELDERGRTAAPRVLGGLFLAGFLCYGTGFALVTSVVGEPGFLPSVGAHRTTLTVGAFLMLLNVFIDIGKGVLFFPILDRRGRRTALAYLTMMSAQAVLLGLGVFFLLMVVPLHDRGADPMFGELALDANNLVYQIGELLLGVAGVALCALLLRHRLIPRYLAWWGAAGYVLFACGTVAELFGVHAGLALSIPGGLFEVALGIWLLSRSARRPFA